MTIRGEFDIDAGLSPTGGSNYYGQFAEKDHFPEVQIITLNCKEGCMGKPACWTPLTSSEKGVESKITRSPNITIIECSHSVDEVMQEFLTVLTLVAKKKGGDNFSLC
jgi:hypothetical protein